MPVYRSLSSEGQKEIGHIFKGGVPVQTYIPVWAKLRGQLELVFYVDWNSLGENQKLLVLEYMSKKFDASQAVIRKDIETDTHFPILKKWVIESYDMRFLI